MNIFYKLLVLAFFLIGIPRIAWCMMLDYKNPQRWTDLNHNFPLEAVLLGVFLVLAVALGVYVWRTEKRNQQCRRARERHSR